MLFKILNDMTFRIFKSKRQIFNNEKISQLKVKQRNREDLVLKKKKSNILAPLNNVRETKFFIKFFTIFYNGLI